MRYIDIWQNDAGVWKLVAADLIQLAPTHHSLSRTRPHRYHDTVIGMHAGAVHQSAVCNAKISGSDHCKYAVGNRRSKLFS